MFTTRVDIRKEKAPTIGSYNDTSGIVTITTLKYMLKHARSTNFDQLYKRRNPYTQLLLMD
jgi:hypothetical protein